MKKLIGAKAILSAHDVSEGGLFIALLESAMVDNFGFKVENKTSVRNDAWLFGESQSRVVVSVSAANKKAFLDIVGNSTHEHLGTVTSGNIVINGSDWGTVAELKAQYEGALEEVLVGGRMI